MLIDDQISSRIKVLRFPLIVGVVFIHNLDTTVHMARGSIGVASNSGCVDFVRFFISDGVARVTVPLFFLISGYLFFLGEWSWGTYFHKLKRRLNTLLVPFLLWNIVTLAIFAVVQSVPQTKMYFAGTLWPPVHSFSFLDYINALFGLTVRYPISYQFWFIRDLMALVVLAPAVHFLMARKSATPFVIALFCMWFSIMWPVLWPSAEAFFFFSLGAYLSRPGESVIYLDRFGPFISAMFLGLLIFCSAFPSGTLYLHKLMIVFGVPSLWWLTKRTVGTVKSKSALIKLSNASFFVFAAHEPLLMIIRKGLYRLLFPTSSVAILALYFLIPMSVIAFLLAVHRSLLMTIPSFVGFITGSIHRSNKSAAEGPVLAQS